MGVGLPGRFLERGPFQMWSVICAHGWSRFPREWKAPLVHLSLRVLSFFILFFL